MSVSQETHKKSEGKHESTAAQHFRNDHITEANDDTEVLGDVRTRDTHTVRKCQLMVPNRMPTKHSRTARMMMPSWNRGGFNNTTKDCWEMQFWEMISKSNQIQ